MSDERRSAATLGFGLAYSLAAVGLLAQATGLAAVPWSVVVPAILVLCGMAVVLSGVAGTQTEAPPRREG